MKKMLYISVNTKPEEMSTSKTFARDFINKFIAANTDYSVEELDLYAANIPEIHHRFFTNRAEPVSGDAYNELSEPDKCAVDIINQLCSQFMSADMYVIATPMWSISFPSILKKYIDCIVINHRTIEIADDNTRGLLNDKKRDMVYIQSSGGVCPLLLSNKLNHGVEYCHDLFKFLGINKFERILIQGVDDKNIGKGHAIVKANREMESVLEKVGK
jgi:FMN-dependent NADH-azoreductase